MTRGPFALPLWAFTPQGSCSGVCPPTSPFECRSQAPRCIQRLPSAPGLAVVLAKQTSGWAGGDRSGGWQREDGSGHRCPRPGRGAACGHGRGKRLLVNKAATARAISNDHADGYGRAPSPAGVRGSVKQNQELSGREEVKTRGQKTLSIRLKPSGPFFPSLVCHRRLELVATGSRGVLERAQPGAITVFTRLPPKSTHPALAGVGGGVLQGGPGAAFLSPLPGTSSVDGGAHPGSATARTVLTRIPHAPRHMHGRQEARSQGPPPAGGPPREVAHASPGVSSPSLLQSKGTRGTPAQLLASSQLSCHRLVSTPAEWEVLSEPRSTAPRHVLWHQMGTSEPEGTSEAIAPSPL